MGVWWGGWIVITLYNAWGCFDDAGVCPLRPTGLDWGSLPGVKLGDPGVILTYVLCLRMAFWPFDLYYDGMDMGSEPPSVLFL